MHAPVRRAMCIRQNTLPRQGTSGGAQSCAGELSADKANVAGVSVQRQQRGRKSTGARTPVVDVKSESVKSSKHGKFVKYKTQNCFV